MAVSGGLVYVADTQNNRIVSFNPTNFAATFTSYGSLGSGSGQFNDPQGIAVSNGLVYVMDSNNNRVVSFNPTNFAGTFTTYGSSAYFNAAVGLAVSNGMVYVADRGNERVDEFNPTNLAGTFSSFGTAGSGPGQFAQPVQVAADGSGNIYVADEFNNRIVELHDSSVSVVPEPSSLTLLAVGGALALALVRRRRALVVPPALG